MRCMREIDIDRKRGNWRFGNEIVENQLWFYGESGMMNIEIDILY